MKIPRTPSLEERIRQIRAEVETIIEARVAAIAGQTPGVPAGVIRNLITARAPACTCAQYLTLRQEEAGDPL
jgi:hypothetical protein